MYEFVTIYSLLLVDKNNYRELYASHAASTSTSTFIPEWPVRYILGVPKFCRYSDANMKFEFDSIFN